MQDWKIVKTSPSGQEYVEARELSSGTRSSCRAVFFRNTHESTGEKIISLKVARTQRKGGVYQPKPDKTITLTSAELDKLIAYIQEYYTPLNIGMTEFIAADEDAAKLFAKIRELGISDDEVVDKLHESGILTENLSVAITAASRNYAIQDFEDAIDQTILRPLPSRCSRFLWRRRGHSHNWQWHSNDNFQAHWIYSSSRTRSLSPGPPGNHRALHSYSCIPRQNESV